MIQVKINSTMIGKTKRNKKELEIISNSDRLDFVIHLTKEHFGDRPVHILDGNFLIENNSNYPEFFAAGWFLGKPLSGGKASELVVVSHGNSMVIAKQNLMNSIKNVDWNNLAKDV